MTALSARADRDTLHNEYQRVRNDTEALAAMAHDRWRLPQLAARYRRFVKDFEPFAALPPKRTDPRDCHVVRTMLIHEYRRILLSDPDLPDALLPTDWPGGAAARLARSLYLRLAGATAAFVMQCFVDADGPVAAPGAAFARRFG